MIRKPFLVALVVSLAIGIGAIIGATLRSQTQAQAQPAPTPRVTVTPTPSFNDYMNAPRSPERLAADAPCQPLHFGFDGNPRNYESDLLRRYRVTSGRTWRITNVSLMMERYDGGKSVAGEWTGVIGGVQGRWHGVGHGDGTWFTIGQASLDNGSGMSIEQGRTDVILSPGDHIAFITWLRPGTSPSNYYYTLAASGMDCPI